ncbi:hypothetical protein BBO99_00005778 [Phytophthora kernoviae]|uniref:FYVE-type domain-containing protein n=2 Tax=Phytophthora kernoviae TaxID=325452 RepID=A0A3R7H8M1_9STRA|nr:hypothetical protein G195_006411 [Phytophthora kernoviae 00238/432]KAG2524908.1 hypothetical protein JM18_005172 [Phytophthora kernoviae]RLN36575.1 hypothetical protein BBI17_005809 [Phytophthora kernoviae]RLN78700.1 hypothetical protein BBO99_00005778 [Phytophthora kernoviae]
MARGAPSSSRVAAPAQDLQASQRTWTPLREDYFQPPLLSSRERQYLVRKSCEAAQELVERARSAGGPIAWRHVEKNNGVQVYAGAPRSGAAGAALSAASMCGVTCVPGTVKEVASLFQLGSSRSMKEFARAHREWFYDGVVLHTLAPRTKEKPLHQVTAKWMVVQTPHGLPHRDFCYLECQDKFIDARGRKGWVLGQHSIKLPGCDDLKKEFGLIRGSLYHSGFVVVESEERPGHVDVIHLVQINFKEHTPVPASFLRARVVFVAQVRNMLRSKRLNEQRYLNDLELVPRKYRARCSVCQDSFSLLLLRKLNCRKCGEVVCAACSKEFPIENRNFAATNGGEEVRKLRICMHCFQVITNAPKPTSALAEPPHSSTMSMSFMGYHDDEKRASYMTQRSRRQGHGEDEAPKIFLQSMRREKPRRRMSSTSPIPGFGADMPPSTSRHRTAGDEEYGQLYERSQRYQQQRQDHGRSHHQVRGSQHMRPSEFRPSMSLSLDDPISRGEGRDTLQMPGPPRIAPPASIFDRPANGGPSRRPQSGLPRSNSSDMLLDDDEERTQSFKQTPAPFAPLPKHQHIDDGAEETKAHEFAKTPALPPPSPSAHTATRKVLERESIANSLALADVTSAEPERTKHFVDREQHAVPTVSKGTVAQRDLNGHEHHLQDAAPKDDTLGDLAPDQQPPARAQADDGHNDDHEVDTVARKYTVVGSENEGEEEDLVDHEHRDLEEAESDDDNFAQRDSELLLNTAGCDMNYLDADMRQFHDQSLFMRPSRSDEAPSFHGDRSFSSQLKDGMSAIPLTDSSEARLMPANNAINQKANVATPPYEHMPTSPKGESGKSLDSATPTTRPIIHRDDTFALERMDLEERQVSRIVPAASAGHVVLDAMVDKSSPAAVEMSTIRTDDHFAVTGDSMVSVPVEGDAKSLTFHEDEDDSGDENMLLSARQLYEHFGNTTKLSQMAGNNRPGFQRTLSQIQQSFDQLSDSESEEDTRVSSVAARRR